MNMTSSYTNSRPLYTFRRHQCSPYDPQWHHRRNQWTQSSHENSSVESLKKECNRKLKCTVNLLVSLLLCLGGTVWQLSSIGAEYFEYAVVSEVSLVKVYDVEPPAMSICLPYIEMIGRERLNVSPEDFRDLEKLSEKVSENYTISQLFALTPDIESIILVCWIRRVQSYDIDADLSKFLIKKYIRDSYVCYRFTHINQGKVGFLYRSHHIQYGKKRGGLMSVRLNKTFLVNLNIDRFIVFLHPFDMYPHGDRDYALHLIAEENVFAEGNTIWAISWTKVTQTLLPPPYSTNCADNQKMGFENREHCQHTCVSDKVFNKYGKSSFTLPQESPTGYTVLSQAKLLHNRSLEQEVDSWIEECNSTCWGHNCIRVNFCPLVTSTMEHAKYVGFQLFDQNGPETRIVFVGKLSLVNFLVYILSIVGVWLGISCLDISKMIIRLLARIQRMKLSCEMCNNQQRQEEYDANDGITDHVDSRVRGNICLSRVLNSDKSGSRNVTNQSLFTRENNAPCFINRPTVSM